MAKIYKATFDRYNPQLGTYKTDRIIEAENKRAARKRAKEIEKHCIYGSMSLVALEEKKNG